MSLMNGLAKMAEGVSVSALDFQRNLLKQDADRMAREFTKSEREARQTFDKEESSTGRRETHDNAMKLQGARQDFDRPLNEAQTASLRSGTARADEDARRKREAGDAVSGAFGGEDYQKKFIESVQPYADKVAKETGLDPRLVIAQAALESDWGRKAPGNNFFGVKGAAGAPDSQMLDTQEADSTGKLSPTKAPFRTYGSVAESFDHYGKTITENSRYAPVRSAKDLEAQIEAIGKSGYATDPNYGKKVGQIARSLDGIGKPGVADDMPAGLRTTIAAVARYDPDAAAKMMQRWQEHKQTLDFNTKSATKFQLGDGGVMYALNPVSGKNEPVKIDGEIIKFSDPEKARAQAALINSITSQLTDASRANMRPIQEAEARLRLLDKLVADPLLNPVEKAAKKKEHAEAKTEIEVLRKQYDAERKPLLDRLNAIGGVLAGKANLPAAGGVIKYGTDGTRVGSEKASPEEEDAPRGIINTAPGDIN